jgi:hypothetical protein
MAIWLGKMILSTRGIHLGSYTKGSHMLAHSELKHMVSHMAPLHTVSNSTSHRSKVAAENMKMDIGLYLQNQFLPLHSNLHSLEDV